MRWSRAAGWAPPFVGQLGPRHTSTTEIYQFVSHEFRWPPSLVAEAGGCSTQIGFLHADKVIDSRRWYYGRLIHAP